MEELSPQTQKFWQAVLAADKILVTSHISPDPDAVSSTLLLGTTLQKNFSDKHISMVLEEETTDDLSFLEGYGLIEFAPLPETVAGLKPQLLIMVDANSFHRVTRAEPALLKQYLAQYAAKTAVIDHHELDGQDKFDVLINNKRPATAEEVYVLCFDELKLDKPSGFAELALLGIISDTQRHRFDHPGYRETYRVVSELLDAGASIEKLEARLEHHTKNELEVIGHLASNAADSGKGYTYSYIDDEFYHRWLESKKPLDDLKKACDEFTNRYLRSFEGNSWGFLIYPDSDAGADCWNVSFRSSSGVKDVSAIARTLGGGGHKPAAGAKLKADSVQDVLRRVQQAIAG